MYFAPGFRSISELKRVLKNFVLLKGTTLAVPQAALSNAAYSASGEAAAFSSGFGSVAASCFCFHEGDVRVVSDGLDMPNDLPT
jgi:hypothetical protein